jgi:hypothetical protein
VIDNDTLEKIVAGASGSGIAAWIARATGWALIIMFAGGVAASHFVAPAVAVLFSLTAHETTVGFVVGFLAILMLRKLHDVIDSIPAGSLGGALVEWVRKMLGLPTPPQAPTKGGDQP